MGNNFGIVSLSMMYSLFNFLEAWSWWTISFIIRILFKGKLNNEGDTRFGAES